ncbi:MAG: TraB/VirB10 family protein [Rubrivivax sp.]|jgi:conjugal transfer pilus assembly protein TraB|nr:TraB/VirB10 family protein [Rubrivivax sp.]
MTEQPLPPGNLDAPGGASAERVKRRQYLLLAGIAGVIVAGTVLSVSLTGSGTSSEPAPRPKSTNILSPGAQVDPRDAWRGQADAQLRSIEQRSRELTQRGSELEGQSRDMMERLKRLEAGNAGAPSGRADINGLTPLPPPPLPAPATRPNFGPDPVAAPSAANPAQRLPPPPAPATLPAPAAPRAGLPGGPGAAPSGLGSGGIVSITLADPAAVRTGAASGVPGSTDATGKPAAPSRDTRRYLPSGSFTRALLLGGLDAPTGGQAQRNPQPVLLRLLDHAVLPNQFRGRIKECFVVGAGYGDVSAERAYIRTESLSCVARDGTAIDVPIRGYVAGEDGKAGMRGRLVSKQGQILANALLAGVASGIGTAFQQSATTVSVSPLGTTGTVDPGKQLQAGLGTGVGRALDRLAQYYITLAEKVFPVIEVDAGRTVDVVLTQGIALGQSLDGTRPDGANANANTDPDRDAFPHLARRTPTARRTTDEDDED